MSEKQIAVVEKPSMVGEFKYQMLRAAVDRVLSCYDDIKTPGWCEPCLQTSLEDLQTLVDAITDAEHSGKLR